MSTGFFDAEAVAEAARRRKAHLRAVREALAVITAPGARLTVCREEADGTLTPVRAAVPGDGA